MLNKNILVDDIRTGMIVGADAINARGEVVVPKGTILTQRHQSKLKTFGIKAINVTIPDYIASPQVAEPVPAIENPLKQTDEYKSFRRSILNIASALSDAFDAYRNSPDAHVDCDKIIDSVNDLALHSGSSLHLLELLQCSRDFDDSIYAHSVNVTLISRIIGIKAQFNDTQMHDLLLSALFHDIGKLGIPDEILYKSEPLEDEEKETIKEHASIGYSVLVQTELPDFVSLAALHHHEHYDGSGYPGGLKGQHIPLYARYVAVADVYNAMTSKRPYREEICPFEVIATFERDGFQRYDAAALLPFLNSLAQSQIGANVMLNNGQTGKIIMLSDRLSKPIVQVGKTFIDLMKRPDLEIVKII